MYFVKTLVVLAAAAAMVCAQQAAVTDRKSVYRCFNDGEPVVPQCDMDDCLTDGLPVCIGSPYDGCMCFAPQQGSIKS
ncbi:hypothetical protein OG21DRAFT_1517550, partial [Imleria badia]